MRIHLKANPRLEPMFRQIERMLEVFSVTAWVSGLSKKDAKDKEAVADFYEAAEDYALLGDKDAALTDLERAALAGQQLDALRLDPELDSVRSDPRYRDLLRRIGLPE
jgi:hypothetical protein